MKKSLVSPSFIKQKARQLKKEKGLSQSKALDEAVKQFGYSNYKNYLNVSETDRTQTKSSKESILKQLQTEKDLSKRVELALLLIQKSKLSFSEVFDLLKLFRGSEKALKDICESTSLRSDIQKFVFDDFIESDGELELDDHFIIEELVVNDLTYDFQDGLLNVMGSYDLKLKFEFEVPDEMKHLPNFNRDPMSGGFDINIDRDKTFTVLDSSIGW